MTEEIIETPAPGPYFRFTDEAAWVTAAKAAGFYVTNAETETEDLLAYTADRAIDVIGTLYNDDAVYDEEGEEVTAPTPMDGWHVNYLGDLPDGWETYEVHPEPPKRIFAN
mgnify:CR=1 FL=1